ncbi:YppE family protein [Staphylococcus epidermidis]|uniref:YppE family protein n=1 Tax=Staphylococcus epidermidis TaxID=1282 RepID=UPI000E696961|nr:YppE family protein [Staphylococcus epidermidis]MCG1086030.1 YppE family protein [Staphylococcus epidermidis]MCG2152009.1 YppE family protein [Staphylococcus epidermidis]RIL62140.1 DUF1798 family protein [Staphylococcus epidermidis]UIK38396.1 YppE family protein [Staphylococcus epidermidis]UTF15908.1 YppE family protein [Staphylococcus epidermidis]
MYQIIKQLLEDIDEMNYRYQHVKMNGGSFDFYKDVEPYVKNIDNHLEALNCYSKSITETQYMNQQKLDLLILNIQKLSVDCHFPRTSRKLFVEKLKSAQYDLKNILSNDV